MRAPLPCAIAAGALLLAGCGDDEPKTVDHVTLETAIEVSVAKQRQEIVIASCPKGIERKKGKRFNCLVVTEEGREHPFRVRVKDDEGRMSYVGLGARSP